MQSAVFKLVSYLSVLSLGGLWRHCRSVALPKSSSPKFLSRPSRIWGGHVTSGGNMTSDDDEDDKIKDNVTSMTTTDTGNDDKNEDNKVLPCYLEAPATAAGFLHHRPLVCLRDKVGKVQQEPSWQIQMKDWVASLVPGQSYIQSCRKMGSWDPGSHKTLPTPPPPPPPPHQTVICSFCNLFIYQARHSLAWSQQGF